MSSETIIEEQAFRDSEPVTGEKQFLIDRAIEDLQQYCNQEPREQIDLRPLPNYSQGVPINTVPEYYNDPAKYTRYE